MVSAGEDGRAGGAQSGRAGDLRDLLALVDFHRVVALTGASGVGRSALLLSLAEAYGLEVYHGRAPDEVGRGELVLLDDAEALSPSRLSAIRKKVLAQDGRLVAVLGSSDRAPNQAEVYRLTGLGEEAALALAVSLGVPDVPQRAGLLRASEGHPGVIRYLAEVSAARVAPAGWRAAIEARIAEGPLAGLSPSALQAAAALRAAGGWLPAQISLGEQAASLEVLADAGLVELVGGGAEASPVLMCAALPEPHLEVLERALEHLAARRGLAKALVCLAEAHLRDGLGQRAQALEALREGYRASVGARLSPAWRRGLATFVEGDWGPLRDAALLFLAAHDYAEGRPPALAEATLRGVLDREQLERPEVFEARLALAHLALKTRGLDAALGGFVRVGELAAAEGDLYAETLARLGQGWMHLMGDEHASAARAAERAVRLSRKAEAPGLQGRALFCLAQAELAEGALDAAGRRLEQALRIFRRFDLAGEGVKALVALAELAGRLGRPSDAAEHLDEAAAILRSSGADPARRAELRLTRADVALRRGHARRARSLLQGPEMEAVDERWRLDLLRAEAEVAAADYERARWLLQTLTPHPARAPSWQRRKAAAVAALAREGLDDGLDVSDCADDPLSALILARGRQDVARGAALIAEIEAAGLPEEAIARGAFLQEAAVVRLLQGRMGAAMTSIAELRAGLAERAAPTALVLVLEAVEQVFRGELGRAALLCARAHRSAYELGHRRLDQIALEGLVCCHLMAGQARGMAALWKRGEAEAARTRSPMRQARWAALRLAAARRFEEAARPEDLALVEGGADRLSFALATLLAGRDYEGPFAPLATYLSGFILHGQAEEPDWARVAPEAAVELSIDLSERRVTLAGGKQVSFKRRRVLWRLLVDLWEHQGDNIEPADLYLTAWQLPFNASRLNSLYVGVRRLRLLVEPDPSAPRIILAGAAGGYHMDVRRVRAEGELIDDEG